MGFFTSLSKTAMIMVKSLVAVCVILLIIGLCVIYLVYPFEEPLPFILGLTIGGVQSIIKIILLERSINRTLDMDKEQAQNIARLHTTGRFLLTAFVFGFVIIFPRTFGLFGAILGVLALQAAVMVTNIVLKRLDAKP